MWQVTWLKHAAKLVLPFGRQLRSWWRRVHPPRIGPQHDSVISGGVDHVWMLRKGGLNLEGATVLELGTGWFPIIPLILRLAGVRTVYTVDAHPLLDINGVRGALEFIKANQQRISRELGVPPEEVEALVESAGISDGWALDQILDRLRIVYLAPFTIGNHLPAVDAVVSQTVLEHIEPSLLENMMHALEGFAEGGLMSHGVDNTDHRSHHDPRLPRFDFLKYEDRVWRLLCVDPQDYTNRLRHSDYLALFERTGHEVIAEATFVDRGAMASLTPKRLASRFRGRSPEDLATGWSHILTRVRFNSAREGSRPSVEASPHA